jgi:Ca-activated chloride channel family protein
VTHVNAARRGVRNLVSVDFAVELAREALVERREPPLPPLVISDGIDHSSRHSYTELRRRVGEFDVQLYGIVINEPDEDVMAGEGRWAFEDLTRQTGRRTLSENADAALGRAALGELASTSGGASYAPQTGSEREPFDICTQIGLEMRRQYSIGFYPTDASGRTGRHKIRIRVIPREGAGSLRLSYREGYRPRKS